MRDFTLMSFLDRFSYRNPKKRKEQVRVEIFLGRSQQVVETSYQDICVRIYLHADQGGDATKAVSQQTRREGG